MTQYLDIATVAKARGVSRRHQRRLCERGKVAGAVCRDGKWLIPNTAYAEMLGVIDPQKLDAADLANVPAKKRSDALAKLGHIRRCEKFAASRVAAGGNRTEALRLYAAAHKLAVKTLYRWLAEHKTAGLIGLVDKRGGGDAETITPDAFEMFKSLYLDQRRPTVKNCLQNVAYINHTQQKGWQLPSLRTMQRIVERDIPLPVAVLHREGLGAYEAMCAPYIQRDPDSVEPGAVWVGDHSQFNLWVRSRGRWVRPWLTAWQDLRSRTIVGWYVSASPNQTTIMLAMKRGIEKYGPPDCVKIDNGRDYDSEMWTGTTKARRRELSKGYIDENAVAGLYALMCVNVSFAIPYHPQSKQIERFFDTLDVQFAKTFATYCGKDTERKPDYLVDLLKSEKGIQQAYSLDDFSDLVAQYIEVHNNTAHSGAGMEGRSPAQVIAGRTSRRVMVDGVLELFMRVWSGEINVSKNGVTFRGLKYGQFNPELMIMQGKKVRVAYDPDDLSAVHVYDATTWRLITIAEENYLVGADEESLREAMREKTKARKIVKQYKNSKLAAVMDLRSLTLRAMQAKMAEPASEQKQNLRPVVSPLNSQINESLHRVMQKAVRKAAGAEGLTSVPDLAIDFNEVSRQRHDDAPGVDLGLDFAGVNTKSESIDLKLFENG